MLSIVLAGLGAPHQEQVLAVPPDAIQAWPQARFEASTGPPWPSATHDPRISRRTSWILIAPALWEVGEGRLHRDHAVEQ